MGKPRSHAHVQPEFRAPNPGPGSSAKSPTLALANQYTTAAMVRMGARGRWPNAGRQSARLQRSDASLTASAHRHRNAPPRTEMLRSARRWTKSFFSRGEGCRLRWHRSAGKDDRAHRHRAKGAEAEGYRVEGFAPTFRAAQTLGEARHGRHPHYRSILVRGQQPEYRREKRLYVLDESSLASTGRCMSL